MTIVNNTVNDVAVTVLPDAPIDPATGLPVPTIAVATDGGVSVIKDDGTVVDLTYMVAGDNQSKGVAFLADGGIGWASRSTNRYIQVLNAIPSADYSSDPDRLYVEGDVFGTLGGNDLALLNVNAATSLIDGACAGDDGVTLLAERPDAPEKGMVAYTTSTYNTGWMNGDIKGAFLSDTDDTDLVGGTDNDRSVNANPLTVNGTVTRSPVATGADLVAYSGFSASNYLEQPYNPDLDFGTGDYCVMGWVKTTDDNAYLWQRNDSTGAGEFFQCNIGHGIIAVRDSGGINTVSVDVGDDVWHLVCQVRRSGNLHLYIDGVDQGSVASASDLDNTTATFSVGSNAAAGGSAALNLGSLALLRISATAPTDEQIAKIYEDEKVLFQENAACTLYGTSDAVTALAHDPDTDLLHVGTSDGRSVFRGLERIQNTTTSVSKAISASGGLVAEK